MFCFNVTKNRIAMTESEVLVSGSSKIYDCAFEFSADWHGLISKVVFTVDADLSTTPLPVYYLYLDEHGMCHIPRGVLSPVWDGYKILVGACGTRGDDTVLPTVWVSLGTLQPGASGDPDVPSLRPDAYKELIEKIGDLETLTTDDKTSLVNAINELNAKIEQSCGESGDYELPIATDTTLGGVKIGENIDVTQDGTISASDELLSEDDLASTEDLNEMLDEVFMDSSDP